MCDICGAEGGRGTCPWSIACPKCRARPGTMCKSEAPSGHRKSGQFQQQKMCEERYRTTEKADALACPGFEPFETPDGTGCAHCSGLPEDHAGYRPPPARPAQAALFA